MKLLVVVPQQLDKKQHLLKINMKRGFSLIELLIAMGLVGILIGTVTVMLFSSLKGAKKAEALGVTKVEGSYAMNAIRDKIKYARTIRSGCNGGSIQIERLNQHLITYSLNGTKIASNGALPNGQTVAVDLTSPNVVIRTCAGRELFTCPNSQSVQICFMVDKANSASPDDSATVRMESSVTIRNTDN